ncbi:hypothetical protein H1V43_32220 [Streptomyces sp. PSKA54]|uniref:Uncharacterized protein n=1 Tax=Streptomyces himalayensis subsp. aureolus TaxID=2758039 RepID=A0A7W2D778_9ACTN|nr:hypothetical protein [Streptomyces himalayensis]MBA4865931.1 hypothetical protein [Streptomyces himalayensis subsp. aureolus]
MASRSRKYTRAGADPTGRFRPPLTKEQEQSAEELLKAISGPTPAERYRSPDSKHTLPKTPVFSASAVLIFFGVIFLYWLDLVTR